MQKIATISSSAVLALCAGQAMAQVAVDGRIDSAAEGSLYAGPRWVQNVPTHFGDNAPPPGGCNENDIGDRASVSTGIEFKIPLSSIGGPNGPIKILAILANGGHNAFTNQTLPAAVTLSIQPAEPMFQGPVDSGIARGLDAVAHVRYTEMTPTHLEGLRARFPARTL